MLAATPVDVAPLECEMRPYMTTLYADPAKKSKVNLPLGATLRKCSSPAEGSQVLTAPDSGGTEMCVLYEFGVDANKADVQIGKMRTGVGKSLADKKCPAIDYGKQSYPGKDYFFLSDNVPLPNAFAIKARVETAGLAFLKDEQKARKDGKPAIDFGNSPLGVASISQAPALECRQHASFFEGRYAACYRAEFYNKAVRGGWTLLIALNKKREYQFIESAHELKGAATR
ncbi:hypothetical protein [Massilia sp. TSP1-1-2]|uniref:hypothetical protein n=1 Tax=unclassified Massilia TaxID=2609279 RepID=UPI003CF07884